MAVCIDIKKDIIKDKTILYCKKCGLKTKGLSKNKILCNNCFKELKKEV